MATSGKISATLSTYGEPINITGLAAGTAQVIDDLPRSSDKAGKRYQLWVWAANNDTVRRLLTVVLGSIEVKMWVPPQSGLNNLVVPGIPVAAPLAVTAYADSAGVVQVVSARKELLTMQDFQP